MSNKFKAFIKMSKIRTYYHISFKNLYNKSILTIEVGETRFLDLQYGENNSGFWDKKLKKER